MRLSAAPHKQGVNMRSWSPPPGPLPVGEGKMLRGAKAGCGMRWAELKEKGLFRNIRWGLGFEQPG